MSCKALGVRLQALDEAETHTVTRQFVRLIKLNLDPINRDYAVVIFWNNIKKYNQVIKHSDAPIFINIYYQTLGSNGECSVVLLALDSTFTQTLQKHSSPPQPPTVQCTVQRWAPFLSAQWCKDDLKASGSRESPYTPV